MEFELQAELPVKGLTARLFGDRVRASLSDGTALPRIAPQRLGIGLQYATGPWQLGTTVTRASAQNRVAPLETPTEGYTRVDLNAQWQAKLSEQQVLAVYLQLKNATDEQIRVHSSVLKDSVPQPGRTAVAGLRLRW
jgi:iron complex outermembrane recepter protein